MNESIRNPNIADILFGSYIRYDRMYEMTKYAFYGKTDANNVNIFIDCYSLLKSLYTRGSHLMIKDSYAIASCLINLAIHLRAYFESRHNTMSKVYLIYGGARPKEAFVNYSFYNEKNILLEDSNYPLKSLINDNLNIMKILCPYLYDIFCIIDMNNEFSVIASSLIDQSQDGNPNIIYSKDPLSYQLVAFKPRTFLYRPKKRMNQMQIIDDSWVVTKSSLYNAYRYGELEVKKQFETSLDVKMFSILQAISGVKSRNLKSIKTVNNTIKILEDAIARNIFPNGYLANAIFYTNPNPFISLFSEDVGSIITNRFAAIDLPFQTMLYQNSVDSKEASAGVINLYNPQEIRNINDKYFTEYPLDLNRV